MAKQFDVTLVTETVITVEADDEFEAEEQALGDVELHAGGYFDWQVVGVEETKEI